VGLLVLVLLGACSSPSLRPGAKAVIIDQLCSLQPNEAFISEVTQQLNDLGLEVDIHQGDEITVDFYQKLSSHGYKLNIFRIHSVLLVKEGEMAEGTLLFTSEPHSPVKYTEQRLAGSIVKARADDDYLIVFAVMTRELHGSLKMQDCYCILLVVDIINLDCKCFR
jgi:hypothetical protein